MFVHLLACRTSHPFPPLTAFRASPLSDQKSLCVVCTNKKPHIPKPLTFGSAAVLCGPTSLPLPLLHFPQQSRENLLCPRLNDFPDRFPPCPDLSSSQSFPAENWKSQMERPEKPRLGFISRRPSRQRCRAFYTPTILYFYDR